MADPVLSHLVETLLPCEQPGVRMTVLYFSIDVACERHLNGEKSILEMGSEDLLGASGSLQLDFNFVFSFYDYVTLCYHILDYQHDCLICTVFKIP